MTRRIEPRDEDVLLVVDVQNDFCPCGALEVPEGHDVVPVINRLGGVFPHVVTTQDWHHPEHHSFAAIHGREPFETIELHYGEQTLWPHHCVQGTPGADFHPELELRHVQLIVRKGFRQHIDSYSAFYENDQKTPTGLAGYLRDRGFKRVFACGLATDFCVHYSVVDSAKEGFETSVIEDACRAIDLEGSLARAMENMKQAGVAFVRSEAFSA
jgi:nicotinamidase/pyrazinamidase